MIVKVVVTVERQVSILQIYLHLADLLQWRMVRVRQIGKCSPLHAAQNWQGGCGDHKNVFALCQYMNMPCWYHSPQLSWLPAHGTDRCSLVRGLPPCNPCRGLGKPLVTGCHFPLTPGARMPSQRHHPLTMLLLHLCTTNQTFNEPLMLDFFFFCF